MKKARVGSCADALVHSLGGAHGGAHEQELVAVVAAMAKSRGEWRRWWRWWLVAGKVGGNGGKLSWTLVTVAVGGKELLVAAVAGSRGRWRRWRLVASYINNF